MANFRVFMVAFLFVFTVLRTAVNSDFAYSIDGMLLVCSFLK